MVLKKYNKKYIAVTIGDIEGIGFHLIIKEFLNKKINNFILITNISIFKKRVNFPLKKINLISDNKFSNFNKNKLNIYSYKTKNIYSNTLDSLKIAYSLTKSNLFIGVLTLPLNKNKIISSVNKEFIDQTTFFSKKDKKINSNMIFYYNNKFFIPLTIHVELKNVYKYFKNKKLITSKIENLYESLIKDFKINKPKLLIAGINPHAGENKSISKDESLYLEPIIKNLKKRNFNISGPVSGDSMINSKNLKKFDAFIFTFHDQALIPFKMISNYKGVNFTSNLDIIRVSPSHGTAEDLIKSKKAYSSGILSCFRLIKKIYKNRIN